MQAILQTLNHPSVSGTVAFLINSLEAIHRRFSRKTMIWMTPPGDKAGNATHPVVAAHLAAEAVNGNTTKLPSQQVLTDCYTKRPRNGQRAAHLGSRKCCREKIPHHATSDYVN